MKLGFHVSKNGQKMHKAISRAIMTYSEYPIKCVQIFVTGPQTTTAVLKDDEISGCAEISKTMAIVIHGAYVDNGWTERSFVNIQRELDIAARMNARGIIFHLSKRATANIGLLKQLKVTGSQVVFLEINAAKCSPDTFETVEKIKALFTAVHKLNLSFQVGLCVDSAHLSSIGTNLRDYDYTRKWLAALPAVPIMFHLNDSATAAGSGVDKHEVLYKGTIWRDAGTSSGINAIIEYANENACMVIIERDSAMEDLKILRDVKLI